MKKYFIYKIILKNATSTTFSYIQICIFWKNPIILFSIFISLKQAVTAAHINRKKNIDSHSVNKHRVSFWLVYLFCNGGRGNVNSHHLFFFFFCILCVLSFLFFLWLLSIKIKHCAIDLCSSLSFCSPHSNTQTLIAHHTHTLHWLGICWQRRIVFFFHLTFHLKKKKISFLFVRLFFFFKRICAVKLKIF